MRSLPLIYTFAALAAFGLADKTVTVSVGPSSAEETESADRTVEENDSTTKKDDDDDSKSTEEATSTTQELIYVTVAIEPLTTTFTPPATCNENRLTQLASPGYQLWVNEPQPIADSKHTDCFPPQFISRYTSALNQSSSIAPLMSPLVCPHGWHTAKEFDNGYIACCASGYLLAPPSTTSDSNRPAYGGTCYSNFKVGQTATVTAYNETEVTATADWVASTSLDQAYGHVMDGYALDLLKSMSSSSSSTIVKATGTATETSSVDESTDKSSEDSSSVSGGAIAGIVVGAVVGVVLLAFAAFWFYRRRRQPSQHHQIGELGGDPVQEQKPLPPAKDSPDTVQGFAFSHINRNQSQSTRYAGTNSEFGDSSTQHGGSDIVSPLDGTIGGAKRNTGGASSSSKKYAELDSGWKGYEMGGT